MSTLDKNTEPKVDTVGNNIYIVDPNPPEMDMHPPEDMFIYVSFVAQNRNRGTFIGKDKITGKDAFTDSGTAGEINFIATSVSFDSEGKMDPPVQETYATTSYTNIGGIQDAESSGVLEGFGIKSINIKYSASLVPQVDIVFTDVRGAALFDTVTQTNRKSSYSIFFKMPYPIFTLSVKGYFGKTVDYCLHLLNWTSTFDNASGNFDITANFVGFQQAFLADMVLGNIIGVVGTEEGSNALNNIYESEKIDRVTGKLKKNPPKDIHPSVRKLDDFFIRVSRLQIELEDVKSNTDSYQKLRAINTQKKKLLAISGFIGRPMRKATTPADKENSGSKSDEDDYEKKTKCR